ncbi:MAG TPA: ATP-binding protein [Candidatus Binatia bacterium]|nr:ATP-binding protein [Candidatus Binatia bacterium]
MAPHLFNLANYRFNPFAMPTLFTGIAIIALGLIILVGERNSRVSLSFFIMTVAAATWLFCYSLMYCSVAAPVATAWAVVGQLGIICIPAAVYNFTVGTLEIYSKHKIRVWLAWVVSAVFFAIVLAGDVFLSGVNRFWWGYYPRYEWGSVPFLGFFFGLMALSLRHYWRAYHSATPGAGRLRSKALFVAFCIAYLGSFDYLAAFGMPLYPFGYLAVLGFTILAARAVWRFRLVDITPAFAATEIINAMADALLVLDNAGTVRIANRAACQLFKRPEPLLIGNRIQSLTPVIAPPEFILDRVILSGSVRDYEFPLMDEYTGRATLSVSSFAMRDDLAMDPVAFVCIVRDVTEQKKAQLDIQLHTERQAALYEINLATTSTLELRAVLNVLLEKLTALVPDTATTIMLLDKNARQLIKVAARGIDEEAWKALGAGGGHGSTHPVLEAKDAVRISNIRISDIGPDSDYFRRSGFVSYLGVPLMAQDKVLGILSFYCRQERYLGDGEINFLRTLAGQAAGAIQNSQLYEQTKQQAIDLEKANKVKDEFLGVMSHELRTPLNVIAGYTKIVQDGVLGEINAEQVNALDKVTRHSNELLVMVNSIMDATKIEAGAVVVECDEVPLPEFFDELKLLYEYPLGKDVSLRWDYSPNLPIIRTDRDKLKHILQNLINNALKFTEVGHVTVAARHVAGLNRIELSVADTGIGIAPEDLPLVFEKFLQLDASKTRSQGGVGLGLHIVRTFSEILGGMVTVTSQPGEGTTFTVSMPCVYEGAGAVRAYSRRRPEAKLEP